MNIKGSKVLITGGTAGIGFAIAESFAKAGADVMVSYFNNDERAKEKEEKLKSYGVQAHAVKADSADPAQLENLFEQAKKSLGTINILVNNVGTSFGHGYDGDEWGTMFNHHMMSTVHTTNWFEKQIGKESGNIINISSVAGTDPFSRHRCARLEAYCCMKAAINMYTKLTANKFAGKVRVNAVAPGNTMTEGWSGTDEEFKKVRAKGSLIKRFVAPEEIAKAVVHIVDNDAVNGQIFVVDGGVVARGYEG